VQGERDVRLQLASKLLPEHGRLPPKERRSGAIFCTTFQ